MTKVIGEAIEIIKFENSKDKSIIDKDVYGFAKDGAVRQYCVIFRNADKKEEAEYIEQKTANILKLDLYDKVITTVDGKQYTF